MRIISYIVIAVFIGIIMFYSVCNIRDNQNYFELGLFESLYLLAIVVVASIFTHRENSQRKILEKTEEVLSKIQEVVNSEKAYRISSDTDIRDLYMIKRTLSNKINLLCVNCNKMGISKELEYIRTQFIEYRDLIDNHISDLGYLQKSRLELEKKLRLIDDKCDFIKFHMYK